MMQKTEKYQHPMKEKHGNKASELEYKGCRYIGKERIGQWEKRNKKWKKGEWWLWKEGGVRSKQTMVDRSGKSERNLSSGRFPNVWREITKENALLRLLQNQSTVLFKLLSALGSHVLVLLHRVCYFCLMSFSSG